jgi:phenylacetate-coenzyme A ligase PaaK-like adenylate-forming protein
LNSIETLFETDPFQFSPVTSEAFYKSFQACARHHYDRNKFFRALWVDAGLTPEQVTTDEDLIRIPWMMVNLFKEHEMMTGSKEDIVLNLTSSGTSGQKSQIFLDESSLRLVKRLAWQIHARLGMCSDEEVNYLCFTYDPSVATHLGTAFTDELLTSFTRKKSVYYAIQWDSKIGDFRLNAEGVVQTLRRFEKESAPVRILGFPAHMYKIVKDYDLNLKLPKNSWIQTGGGWKGMQSEEIPKQDFRQYMSKKLGVDESHIRDMFGMVEHGIPYCDCRLGRLHVPNYARVLIRSPRDFSVLEEGQVGLMQFFCSYVTSYPSISLMTTDWGRLGRCDCGLGGSTLEVVGRAGVSKHKGCALTASKLLVADESRHV